MNISCRQLLNKKSFTAPAMKLFLLFSTGLTNDNLLFIPVPFQNAQRTMYAVGRMGLIFFILLCIGT